MMRKKWKYLRFLAVPLIALAVSLLLLALLDFFSMGIFADWFERNFYYEESFYREDGSVVVHQSISWQTVRQFLCYGIATAVTLGTGAFMLIADLRKHRIQREMSANLAGLLQSCILRNEPMPLETPEAYAQVIAAISGIRYEMQNREQLLRTETQRKNDLITYLAHDLKTPLTSVIGYLTLLQNEPDISLEMRAKYTGIALRKSERLEELINDLFEITRYNLSSIELQPERVNLSRMAEQVAFEFQPLLADKHLTILSDIAPDVAAYCDADKTERILDNLLRNAVSYSYPDSEICLKLQAVEDTAVLTLWNHGKTIPPEQLERIFEQFFRLDTSRSSASGGSGLGLAIAKRFAEAQGGTIRAESQREKICFTVTLPVGMS